jgi:hypothetical protein
VLWRRRSRPSEGVNAQAAKLAPCARLSSRRRTASRSIVGELLRFLKLQVAAAAMPLDVLLPQQCAKRVRDRHFAAEDARHPRASPDLGVQSFDGIGAEVCNGRAFGIPGKATASDSASSIRVAGL